MLLVPLDQPGIEVRPIRTVTGSGRLQRGLLHGARTPIENVVLGVGQGWKAAMALLGLERGDEAATNPILFRAEVDRLVKLVHERGLAGDEVVRDRVARAYTQAEIMRYLGKRILTGWLQGRRPRTWKRLSPSCTGASTTAK